MKDYTHLINAFVKGSKSILGENLVGIYLHGSAVMECFNPKESDIDLILVVESTLPDETKQCYMDMVVALTPWAPAKGIEFSIVRSDVCKPFIYPTPFELHFSAVHLERYKKDPAAYIEKMKGTDRDLAAHFMVIYHRGKVLYGKEIKEVFAEVDKKSYYDSILYDIENAVEDIRNEPVYMILNLCRVLAYRKNGLLLSKREGGEWGLINIPEKYKGLILQAMEGYGTDGLMEPEKELAVEYAVYMLEQIGISHQE